MHAVIGMPVHVIGAGCAGMRILRGIDELGRERVRGQVTVWDNDVVEHDNIRAQLYDDVHFGMPKVEAAATIYPRWSKMELVPCRQYVLGKVPLSGVVFVCVDTMQSRKDIWEHSIKDNADVALMIEMRLNTDTATVHVVDPCQTRHQQMWEHYWYPDEDVANPGSCGMVTSLGPIAGLAADVAVWQLVRFFEIVAGGEDQLDNQFKIWARPTKIENIAW